MVLDYEEFKEAVKRELKSKMSDELNNDAFSVDIVKRKNSKGIEEEVVTINTTKNIPEGFVAPSLTLVGLYDGLYCKQWQCNFDRTIAEMARSLEFEYRERWNKVAPQGEVKKGVWDEEAFIAECNDTRTTKYGPKEIFFCVVPQDVFADVPGTITVPQPGNLKLIACVDTTHDGKSSCIVISDVNNMKYNDIGLSDEDILQCAYKRTEERIPIKVSPLNYEMFSATNTATFFIPDNSLVKSAREKNADIIYYPLRESGSMFEYIKNENDIEFEVQQAINSYAHILEMDPEVYRSELLVYDRKADKIMTGKDYMRIHAASKEVSEPAEPKELTVEEKAALNAADALKNAGRGM